MAVIRNWDGLVVSIPLGGLGVVAYARTLADALVEYYDRFDKIGSSASNVEDLASERTAFRVYTMDSPFKTERWPILGRAPLSEAEKLNTELFFKQDAISSELSIYGTNPWSGATVDVPATRAECERLERAAVWSAEHIEDRLTAHFKGEVDVWTESLQLK